MIDPNLDRWVCASFRQWFDNNKGTYSIFYEGQDLSTVAQQDHVEFRINGPFICEPVSGVYVVDCEINLLCQVIANNDLDDIRRMTGYFSSLMATNICIFKLGDTVGDDQSVIGTMIRSNKPVDINHYGKIDPKMMIIQATVEAQYCMTL